MQSAWQVQGIAPVMGYVSLVINIYPRAPNQHGFFSAGIVFCPAGYITRASIDCMQLRSVRDVSSATHASGAKCLFFPRERRLIIRLV